MTLSVYTVAASCDYPPLEYIDDNGKIVGYEMDLIQAIANEVGIKIKIVNVSFDGIIAGIQGKQYDIGASGLTITEDRKATCDFSTPVLQFSLSIVTKKDTEGIFSEDDLVGKKVGVQLGTTGDFIASDIADTTVSQYNKAVDAVNDLINGKVDCVIIDKNPALVFESKFEGQVTAVDGAQFGFEAEEYAIAMPKGDSALVEQVNAALAEIKADGTFDQLVATYIESNSDAE